MLRNKRFKKTAALFLAMLLLPALTACGVGQAPAGASTAAASTAAAATTAATTAAAATASPAEEKINMSIMWWGPDTRHPPTIEAIELYSKEVKPNVTFTYEHMAWDGYWSKLVMLAASKNMADVMQMDATYQDNYISNNQLADISAIDFGGIIPEAVLENTKINGILYGAPVGKNGSGIAYNKTAMDKYDIPCPHEGWTWEEAFDWIDVAREKLPEGMYPFFDMSSSWDSYQTYQVAMGKGRVIDGPVFHLDKDLWFDFYQRMARYRDEGKVPTPEESFSFVENDAQFDSMTIGKLIVAGRTVGMVGALISLMPDSEIGVVNWPVGPGGGGWAQATMFLSVGENSKYKAEAMEFIYWFLTDTKAGEILMTVRGLPLSDEVYKLIEPKLQPADQLGKALYDVAVNNKPTPFYPSSVQFADMVTGTQGFYSATIQQVMYDMMSLEEAYEKIVAKGEELGSAPVE
jgi:multiple sugar transport system substrate-binding protein